MPRSLSVAVAHFILVRPMKKPLLLAVAAGLAVVLVGSAFAVFAGYTHARDVREYLPAQPHVAGCEDRRVRRGTGASVASRSFKIYRGIRCYRSRCRSPL